MEANSRKTRTIRHLGTVGIADLREAALAIPESVWDAEDATKPNRFEALDTTRVEREPTARRAIKRPE